jgi:hypothetical protein
MGVGMANNRLYLLDTETGERLLVAKGWGFWAWREDAEKMTEWLRDRDIGSACGPDGHGTKLVLVTD